MKWLYNQKFIASASQFSFLAILVLLLFWGINNAAINLEKAGIASGFGFLHEIAGFDIAQTLIPYDRNSTYLDAFFCGAVKYHSRVCTCHFLFNDYWFFYGRCSPIR